MRTRTEERRTAALVTMWERFPLVAERVRRGHGLRMPRHLAVFAAFWASVNDAEREALSDLMVSPWGVTEYFGDDGLRLVARDELDERLHARFRRDPAEFVTVLAGGSDGLHYGLWYDDPAELPSVIAHNWARDSAETWACGPPTLLGVLRGRADAMLSDYGDTGEQAERMRALIAALDWFHAADREALSADGEPRWASARRSYGAVSLFPALPPGSGDPRLTESNDRLSALQSDSAQGARWIADAEGELAAGRPALALAIGGELHWLDHDQYRRQELDLLVRAYRMLGRDALADIAEIHAGRRDLTSVDVLVRP
ncbi:ADP-ribosylation family protein [Dactylosporangium sp. NPDC048998]|uniref:ADP-ribosylation family protein n=1 Tax=Dactylosporangium sp. NPDC048998 TaxID=3363976 RepID=UPI003713D5EC